ncbi:uncharacterized protein LOC135471430 [Liolophura sinensis]|uniref:uncharacterized protein LOC135471430 n=1 Tax=Liolophura sinensis TaxID=3198878 RepID=UPI0031591606
MHHSIFSALALASMWGMLNAETEKLLNLCGNQMTPDWHIKRKEDLILTIDNNWPVGELSCTVRLAGEVSYDTLYYWFTRFHVSDSSYMTLTLKSNYGYCSQRTYSNLIDPSFKPQKGYNEIIIEVRRGSLSESYTGLYASLTISTRDGSFNFPTWNIIGIVGGIVVFVLVVIFIIYRAKKQARAAGVGCGSPVYPTVSYNNTNTTGAPAGVYPVAPYTPKPYQPQDTAGVYPPPYGFQPQEVPSGYPPPPSDPPPPYYPPYHSTKTNTPT